MNAPAELLEFDVLDHEYSVDGRKLPGVTRVLASQFPLNVPPERLEFARQLGKAIHSATEMIDEGLLDWHTLDARVVPYCKAWLKFKSETCCQIIAIERKVHHPVLRYAGTLDRKVKIAGEVAIIDLKRPVLGPRVGVQLAAYQHADAEHGKMKKSNEPPATKRYGVQLRSDETYRMREYKETSDWSVFVSALTIYNWRAQHGE